MDTRCLLLEGMVKSSRVQIGSMTLVHLDQLFSIALKERVLQNTLSHVQNGIILLEERETN